MGHTFKYELGAVLQHRSQVDFGETFLVIGRYALEFLGEDTPSIWYRVRSKHSHMVDMIEAELMPAETLFSDMEKKLKIGWDKLIKVEQ